MKIIEKILAFISLVIVLLSLSACKTKDNNNTGSGNNSGGVYEKGSYIQVVIKGELESQTQTDLFSALVYDLGLDVRFVDDSIAEVDREIVIGETNRSISASAYQKLRRLKKDNETEVSYLIYVDGNDIAIAYEEDSYGIGASLAAVMNYFLETVVETLKTSSLESGVLYAASIDPIEYQRHLDEVKQNKEWANLEAVAGEDVAEATKEYYSMFSDKLLSWLADLYDPEIGGFYYSNSGRNTEGYLPDIESSFQALSMIENSGMVDHLGGKYSDLPDWFLVKMGTWIKSLQDPCGYFYHPQWGKELTDTKPTRRGRDMNYGLAVMGAAGISPTYDTPTGAKGDYTLIDGTKVDKYGNPIVTYTSSLTGRLSVSTTLAVSKVTATASGDLYSSPQLKDAASFEAYLYSLDIKNNSYSVGNTLSNQAYEIKQRDKELGGALVRILEKWLYENQNPTNGMWEWRSESDPSYRDYDGVNGILKLLTVFNELEIPYPNPIPAARSIVKAIYTDDEPESVCEAYNAWFALEDLSKNLRSFSYSAQDASSAIKEITNELRADAVNLINKTAEKVSIFIKQDSSSSFMPTRTSETSQGMRVAIANTNEGDINATLINTFGVLNHMFRVLGWSKPSMFGKADYYCFMKQIEELGEIIKDEEPAPTPIDFEDDAVGTTPLFVNTEKCNSSGEKTVVLDPTDSKKGNVFKFESARDGNDNLYIPCENLRLSAGCYIFESDFYIITEDEGYFARLYIDNSYSLGLVVKNGRVHLLDTSSNNSSRVEQDLGISVGLEEWFNLRVEYYPGDNETVRAKVYMNGEIASVSDNYYDPNGYNKPTGKYSNAKIEIFNGNEMTILIDNLVIGKSDVVFKEESDPDNLLDVNVDSRDREEKVYDFEDLEPGQNLPEDWIVVDNSSTITVVGNDGNNELSIVGNQNSTINIPAHKRTKDYNALVFEATIGVNSLASSAQIEIMFRDKGVMDTAIVCFRLVSETDEDGNQCLCVYDASAGVLGKKLTDEKIKIGAKTKLKIVYYEENDASLIYIDDVLVGSTSVCEAYANRGGTGKVQIINLAKGEIDVTFDDIKFEKNYSSFDNAIRPTVDSITHGFESGIPEGGSITGATIVNNGNSNKVVNFKNGGKLTIPVNNRSAFKGAFIFNSELNIPSNATDGDCVNLKFVDKNGRTIIQYNIKVSGNEAKIYEVTESQVYSEHIASIQLGTNSTINIVYYKGQDVAHIFVNGSCYAVTSITYTQDSGNYDVGYVIIESGNNGTDITIDNVLMEAYNKFFEHQVTKKSNSENNAEILGFESSTSGNVPNRITTDLRTASAAIRIKEMKQSGKASKVLAFETSAGANDKLYFGMLNPGASGNATVFKADMYIDYGNTGDTTYEIYLSNTNGSHSYLLLLEYANGEFNVSDVTGTSSATVPGRIFGTKKNIGISEGEWFNIRIEYYKGNHDTVRIKTYINNELVYVSSGYYGRSSTVYGKQPTGDINRVCISSYGGVVATMFLDNMSLVNKNATLTNDALTYIPVEAEQDLPNDEDGAEILTFESSVTGNLPSAITKNLSSSSSSISVEEILKSGRKSKVMSLNTSTGSTDSVFVAKTKTTPNYNSVTFSTQICLTTKINLYLNFRSGTNTIYRLNLETNGNGKYVIYDYFNKNYSISMQQGTTTIPYDEWTTLNLVLYSVDGVAKVDIALGDFKIVSANPACGSATPDQVTSVGIVTDSSSYGSILFDNISFAETIRDTSSDPIPHEHQYSSEWSYDSNNHWHNATCSEESECAQVVADFASHSLDENGRCECGFVASLGYFDAFGGYDFTGYQGVDTLVSENVIKHNSGKMSTNKSSATGYFVIYAINGDEAICIGNNGWRKPVYIDCFFDNTDGNYYVFESDVYFGNAVEINDLTTALAISFFDEAGQQYALKTINAVAPTGDKYDAFGTIISAETYVNIGVEYYPSEGYANYYVNGKLALTAEFETTETSMKYVRLQSTPYAGAYNESNYVAFDNMYFDSVKKHLNESEEYYTFSDGKVPSNIRFEPKSVGSSLSVTEQLNNNVLVLDTNAGGDDRIIFTPTAESGANKIVFETKYYVEVTQYNDQMFEYLNSNGTVVGYIFVSMQADGTVKLSDYYKLGGSGVASFKDTTISLGSAQWMDLKLVNYKDEDGMFCTEVWINGTLTVTSKNTHWKDTTIDSVAGLRYKVYSSLDANVYFDDLKFEKIS